MTTPSRPGPDGPDRDPATWESAILLASGTGPGSVVLLRVLAEVVRFRYLDRETNLRIGDADVGLVPTALDAPLGVRALATGRLDEVRLAARDVTGRDVRLRELTVTADGVRLRPGITPTLVTGPVRLTAVLDPDWIAGRVRGHVPGLEVTVDADGVVRARSRTRPGLGAAEIALTVHGHELTWRVVALAVAGRRVAVPRSEDASLPARAVLERGPWRGMRSGTVPLPGLPDDLRLTAVATAPGGVTVHAELPSWTRPLPAAGLDDVVRAVLSLLTPGR